MNWNISAWSIKQPIPSIVLFLILTIAGMLAFKTLGIDENPNIDVPIVSVSVAQPGAAPSELETQITRKIEDAVAGIGNIKHITSTVNEGVSSTAIEFELGTDTDRAVNDVRDAVARIRQQLPGGINDPVITRVDFVGGPFATYAVSAPGRSIADISWLIDNDISRTLLSVPGVGQVQRSGGVEREIRVNLDPVRLEALGLTADMVNNQIRALNINLPGGRGDVGSAEQSIRTLGSAPSVEKLRAERISLPGGGWARLDTLGTITDASAEPRQRALIDGKPAVAFSGVRSTGSNLVSVGKAVDKKLDELRKTLPPDIQITKIRTNATYVLQSYDASLDSLVVGAALAVFVIWLFLKDWRAAVISALAMPLSVIPTFAVMQWVGFTLNNMSLLGLALVIGILVDDAIVEIENIVRHIHMGKTPYDAALEAADEIGLAVIATTMTIIVVFVPVAFMGGIPGQFFKQFGLVVAVAVFFSLLVARLITPMMAAFWMTRPPEETQRSWLVNSYDALLGWAMANRFATILIAVAFFVFSIMLFRTMPTSLVQQVDRGETLLSVEMQPGTPLDETTRAVEKLNKIIMAQPEVALTFATIGTSSSSGPRGGASGGAVNSGRIYIILKPRKERKASQQAFEFRLRPEVKQIAGARTQFGVSYGLSGKLRIVLVSEDGPALTRAADAVIRDMRKIPELADVTSGAALQRPEIRIEPDEAQAAEQGVSVQAIARTAMIATLGDIEANMPKFDLGDRQINIRVQLDPKWRDKLDAIGNLKVMGSGGRLVPLRNVATISVGGGPSQIDRYDRQRQVSIEASLKPGVNLGDAIKLVHALPAFKALPKNVTNRPSGDAEIQRDVFAGFSWAMGAAVLFIYAVLVLLFHDFLHPLTIMMSLPLSIGGALMGLILTSQSLGMYALIGIVMLMGLTTKNGILLVEYCLMAMHKGVPRDEAITGAGEARMRPILMTTIAMIVGMVPIAMGIGAGSEVRASMAIAVIGGLITSTFLTLLVVPVVFTYVDDFKNFWLKRFGFKVPVIAALFFAASMMAAHAAPSPSPAPPYVPTAPALEVPPPVELPPPASVPDDVPRTALSADEAARIALRHQASLVVARANVEIASARIDQAAAPSRPSLSTSATYTDTIAQSAGSSGSTFAVGSSTVGSSASTANSAATSSFSSSSGFIIAATVRQLLYDFNNTRALVRQAQENEKAAAANLTSAQSNLVLQVKNAFYAFVQALRTIQVFETNLRNQREQLALAQGRFNAGAGLPADVLRAQTAVANAIFTLTQARNAAAVARVNLANLMGVDPRTPIEPAESEESDPAESVEALYDAALQRRPEMAAAEATVRAARYGIDAARTNNYPTVSGTVSYTARGQQFYPNNSTVTAGVQVQWSPLDGGLTHSLIRQARATLDSAEAQRIITSQTVVTEVSTAWLNLKTAEQRLATAIVEVSSAEESVRLALGRYRNGLGQILDVLDAQSALLTASTNRVNAQSTIHQARAALERAIGTPLK